MKHWYNMSAQDVLSEIGSNRDSGLNSNEIAERQSKYGRNEFEQQKKQTIPMAILHHLKDISTIILIIAAVISLIMAIIDGHGYIEPAVIAGIVVLNMALGISQERSAEKALEALEKLNSPNCIVIRDGKEEKIMTAELVPGDIVTLGTGDLIPADGRVIESTNLEVDEASLTGESLPSEKTSDVINDEKAPLGDQNNMVFSGCLVSAGRGKAVITETGMASQMGKIAGYLNDKQKIKTPLQKRLDRVAKGISIIAITSAVILVAVGILQGHDVWSMLLLAVALAVAAVPETLTLIVMLSLSNGVKKMVDKNSLIRKLQAVETLGNTSIICSDKTGTLTQNKMTVKKLWLTGSDPCNATDEMTDPKRKFIEMMALASSATISTDEEGNEIVIGDPTESAILNFMLDSKISLADAERDFKKVAEIPFSSDRKMMTVIVEDPSGGYNVLTKGAFDRVPFDNHDNREVEETKMMHDEFAEQAMRIIALASKHIDELPPPDKLQAVENELHLRGIVGIIDPPRAEAIAAVARAKAAGIRTIMITGDHAKTAAAIAGEIGILEEGGKVITGTELSEMSDTLLANTISDYSVYARVSPEDKIRIVEAWQEHNEVVAMTGDGVNDAPALKAADVGVAMGITGTEVSKNASDMVLTDDNFASIIDAIEEGRNVYSNIKKTIYFLLTCNLSEIALVLLAQLMNWGMPVTPILLLLINVIGDGIPGLQIAKERAHISIMEKDPIPRAQSFMAEGLLMQLIRQVIACTAVVLAGFYIAVNINLSTVYPPSEVVGQSVSFLILGWTSIVHIFNVRSSKSVFKTPIKDNMPLFWSAIAMLALFTALIAIPPLGGIFGLVGISGYHWIIAIGLSIIPTIVSEGGKIYDNYMNDRDDKIHKDRVFHYGTKRRLDRD